MLFNNQSITSIMTMSEIQGHLEEIYHTEVSKELYFIYPILYI